MENIDEIKNNISGEPKYRLSNGNLYVSPRGFHYLDYLDPIMDLSSEVDASKLTDQETQYIEGALQSNNERFENQVRTLTNYVPQENPKLLDIGCGGGLFLSKAKSLGCEVVGVELSDSRVQYSRAVHGLEVYKRPIESPFWSESYGEYFDAVSIWDVIEHVNYPLSTLRSASKLLKKGGVLFIDTPCRDSFYHRFGEFSYKVSNGKFPTFLNTMYSSHLFGHKQIFSTSEMKSLLEDVDLEVVLVEKFHELSFPYSYYLKKILKFNFLVKLVLPFVQLFLFVFPIKNKMLAIAKKK